MAVKFESRSYALQITGGKVQLTGVDTQSQTLGVQGRHEGRPDAGTVDGHVIKLVVDYKDLHQGEEQGGTNERSS